MRGNETAGSRRERPTVKHDAILRAGTRVVLELGYAGTSMDAVARAAGVAKQTVYAHFSSKDELFAAIVRDVCDKVVAPLSIPSSPATGIEATMLALAEHFFDFAMVSQVVELHRVITFEARRFPDLGRTYYEAGIDRAVEVVARFLEDETRRGRLNVTDGRAAAEHFYGMISMVPYVHRLLGIRPTFTSRRRKTYLREAVRTFLDGCRAGRPRARERWG